MEPRASLPEMRLRAVKELSSAGIPVCVLAAPMVPGLTDHELPMILKAAAEAGAIKAGYIPLRLPFANKTLFEDWLDANFPDRKEKVLNQIRAFRDGKLNDPNFGSRMEGRGKLAENLGKIFEVACRKFGLNETELELSVAHFRNPGERQLGLL
jgi:DNA repair photolyase